MAQLDARLQELLRNLSFQEKLDAIQLLVEGLRSGGKTAPPPPKPSSVAKLGPAAAKATQSPTRKIQLDSSGGLVPMGRSTPERTMQLSVDDLIDATDEELLESLMQTPLSELAPDADAAADPAKLSPPPPTTPETPAAPRAEALASQELPAPPSSQEVGPEAPSSPQDPVFAELLEELESHEQPLVEMLRHVQEDFWSPFVEGFRGLDVSTLKSTLQTMEFAPLRIAIGGLVKRATSGIVEVYHQQLQEALGEDAEQKHPELWLDKKGQGQLTLALRTPFREYIGRLERLDEARDALFEALENEANTFLGDIHSPLLPPEKHEALRQHQAQGIEQAWRELLSSIREAYEPYTFGELDTLIDTLEQFLSQLEHIYTAVLHRTLEVWNERWQSLQEENS